MATINGIDCVQINKLKVIRVTRACKYLAPLHIADKFELNRRICIVETMEQFLEDSAITNFKNLEVGDIVNIEVSEMTQEEFDKLPAYRLPVL